MASAVWYVYVARCADDSLYCGIARDVAQRIAAHDAGTGARYTRGRGPLRVLLIRRCRDQGRALRLEYAIKQLSRAQKEALVAEPARIARLVRALPPAVNPSQPRKPSSARKPARPGSENLAVTAARGSRVRRGAAVGRAA